MREHTIYRAHYRPCHAIRIPTVDYSATATTNHVVVLTGDILHHDPLDLCTTDVQRAHMTAILALVPPRYQVRWTPDDAVMLVWLPRSVSERWSVSLSVDPSGLVVGAQEHPSQTWTARPTEPVDAVVEAALCVLHRHGVKTCLASS